MTDEPTVEIHIFGRADGSGEGIVIRLPDGSWGVIDCCTFSVAEPERNGILQFLKARQVSHIHFLGLTHPHADHYLGLSQIVESFEVREFWQPGVLDGKRLQRIVQDERISAKQRKDESAIAAAGDLKRLFELIAERRKRKDASRIRLVDVSVNKRLYPIGEVHESSFEIWGVAPSGGQTHKYYTSLSRRFDSANRLNFSEKLNHNTISSAFLLQFGATRIILGGDVETEGWLDAIQELGSSRLGAQAVKVSHHGSTNGYCDGLWGTFAQSGNLVSVITPFARSRLPRAQGLNEISANSQRIFVTSTNSLSWFVPESVSPSEPITFRKSRWALGREFQAKEVSSGEYNSLAGRCSFTFNNRGECIEEQIEAPAVEIFPTNWQII